MQKAKLFKNGQSQAVRLPKEFRFKGSDVYIRRLGNAVILLSKDEPWQSLVASLDKFSDDYFENRDQPAKQKRESFD
jgi:antitoxin VapB